MSQGGKLFFSIALLFIAAATVSLWYMRQRDENAPLQRNAQDTAQTGATLSEPVILSSDPAQGPAGAPIAIIEFSDFRCPHCADAADELKKLLSQHSDKLRLIWKDFPAIPPQDVTAKAHIAARCAEEQGKFWQYHDELFAHQEALTDESQLTASAQSTGLDISAFQSCLASDKAKTLVDTARAEGQNLGINGTPTLFVNGTLWNQPIADIASLIK